MATAEASQRQQCTRRVKGRHCSLPTLHVSMCKCAVPSDTLDLCAVGETNRRWAQHARLKRRAARMVQDASCHMCVPPLPWKRN